MCTCSLLLRTRDPPGSALARPLLQPGGPGPGLLPHLHHLDLLLQSPTPSLSSDWCRRDSEGTTVSPSSLLSCACQEQEVWDAFQVHSGSRAERTALKRDGEFRGQGIFGRYLSFNAVVSQAQRLISIKYALAFCSLCALM